MNAPCGVQKMKMLCPIKCLSNPNSHIINNKEDPWLGPTLKLSVFLKVHHLSVFTATPTPVALHILLIEHTVRYSINKMIKIRTFLTFLQTPSTDASGDSAGLKRSHSQSSGADQAVGNNHVAGEGASEPKQQKLDPAKGNQNC